MHKNKLNDFLNGELNFDDIQKIENTDDFFNSYRTIIEQSQTQTSDFNPFEKIEKAKKKRLTIIKRILPYAASVLLVLSSIFIYQKNHSNKTKVAFNEQEILDLQENTTMALLQFSRELNSCLAKFEDAKKMQQPINELKHLKDYKIQSKNSLKNIKIN